MLINNKNNSYLIMSWFNLILRAKLRFNNNDDFNNACSVVKELDNSSDDKDKTYKILTEYLALNNLFLKKRNNLEMWEIMLNELSEDRIKNVNDAVNRVYKKVTATTINSDNVRAYALTIGLLIQSKGTIINPNKRDLDYDFEGVDDKALKIFVDSFSVLKNSQNQSVREICSFIYKNNFNVITYKNISNDEQSDMFEDVLIAEPIIDFITNLKGNSKLFSKLIYNVFTKFDNIVNTSFDSDTDFIEQLDKTNPDKFLPNLTYNTLKAKKIIDSITSVYKHDDNINLKSIKMKIESVEYVKNHSEILSLIYKDKNIIHIINDVLIDNDDSIINKRKNEKTRDLIYEELNKLLSEILNDYFNEIIKINNSISSCNALLSGTVTINKAYEMPLKECINRWKAFINSDIFKLGNGATAVNIKKDCEDKCTEILKKDEVIEDIKISVTDSEKVDPFNHPNTKSAKEVIDNAMNLIRIININNSSNIYDSILDFIQDNYKKDAEPLFIRISISESILKYLKDVFEMIEFKEKVNAGLTPYNGKYFDAACNIVYRTDKNVNESLNDINVDTFLMYESYVLNEDKDYKSYFDKLALYIVLKLKSIKNTKIKVEPSNIVYYVFGTDKDKYVDSVKLTEPNKETLQTNIADTHIAADNATKATVEYEKIKPSKDK